MLKKLLIVEESLKDLRGHWFELLKIIHDSAVKKGWQTDIACNYNAAPIIRETFSAYPIFKHAKYLDNNHKKLPGQKYYGFLLHNYRSIKAIWPMLKIQPCYDTIFVSTVLIHHLLMWYFIMQFHPHRPKELYLFFITNPGIWDEKRKESYLPMSSFVTKLCIKLFSRMVKTKKVVLAVGTKRSKEEFQKLCGLSFQLMPQPVTIDFNEESRSISMAENNCSVLTFSCLGFARHEKGSDILKLAIEKILKYHEDWPVQFILQWTDDFILPDGSICEPGPLIKSSSKVTLIQKALTSKEYQNILKKTNFMILPYRNSSYYARVSQIATEAVCLGIPIIFTKGGWLEEAISEFGSGISISEGSIDEIVSAVSTIISDRIYFSNKTKPVLEKAREYYSADYFTQMLLKN